MASSKLTVDFEIGGSVLPINKDSVILVGLKGALSYTTQQINEVEKRFKDYFPENKILVYNLDALDVKVATGLSQESDVPQ